MSNFKSSLCAVLGATTLVLLGGVTGCVESETVLHPEPIASIDTADGVHANFYEAYPGELVAAVSGPVSPSLEELNPVEIYEALAAEPAPAVLRDSQTRIARARALRTRDVDPPSSDVLAPTRSTTSNLSAGTFNSQWCGGTWDFDICLTDQTSSFLREFTSVKDIHSHVNATMGSVTHKMSIKHPPFGTYDVINEETVTGSSFISTFTEADNGNYKIEVVNVGGSDNYHVSTHGHR